MKFDSSNLIKSLLFENQNKGNILPNSDEIMQIKKFSNKDFIMDEVKSKINDYVEFLKYNNIYDKLILSKDLKEGKVQNEVNRNYKNDQITEYNMNSISRKGENNHQNIYVREKERPHFNDYMNNQTDNLHKLESRLITTYRNNIQSQNQEKVKLESEIQIKEVEKKLISSENDYYKDILTKSQKNFSINESIISINYDNIISKIQDINDLINSHRLLLGEYEKIDSIQELNRNNSSEIFNNKIYQMVFDKAKILSLKKFTQDYIDYYKDYDKSVSDKLSFIFTANNDLEKRIKDQQNTIENLNSVKEDINKKNIKLISLIKGLNESIKNLEKLKKIYSKKLTDVLQKLEIQKNKNSILKKNLMRRSKEFEKIKADFDIKAKNYDKDYNILSKSVVDKSMIKRDVFINKIKNILAIEENIYTS